MQRISMEKKTMVDRGLIVISRMIFNKVLISQVFAISGYLSIW